MFPFSALDPTAVVDAVNLGAKHHDLFRPLYASAWNQRITFDGALVYASATDEEAVSYTLVFRSGVVESVDTRLLRPGDTIPSYAVEKAVIEGLGRNLRLAAALGVGLPIAVAVSLLGVRGGVLAVDPRRIGRPMPFDRDDLLPPELLLETFDAEPARVLKPVFDSIWNAGGWPGSIYYDEEGNWGE